MGGGYKILYKTPGRPYKDPLPDPEKRNLIDPHLLDLLQTHLLDLITIYKNCETKL